MTQPFADRLQHVLRVLEIDLDQATTPSNRMSQMAVQRLGLIMIGAADGFLAGLDPAGSDTALKAAVVRLFRVDSLVAAGALSLILSDA